MVEVLVVIIIIAILAAILSTAILSAIERAKTASCANNLDQIQKATTLYASDNDGFYPPDSLPYSDLGHHKTNKLSLFKIEVMPYLKSDDVFRCPAGKYYHTLHSCTRTSTQYDSSYFADYANFGKTSFNKKAGTTTIYFQGDSDPRPSESCSFQDCYDDLESDWGSLDQPTSHGEFTNAAYLDGHVKLIPSSQSRQCWDVTKYPILLQ